MALVMPDDRFFPAPDDLHRAVDAALVQAPGCQRQHDLHRHILPPAEGPADGGIDHPHLLERQVQRMGNLLLIFVRPLPGDLHRHAPLLIDIGNACLGLEVSMLLGRACGIRLRR